MSQVHPELTRADSSRMRGFSLLQLVFVLGITMIAAAIALPIFLNTTRPYQVRNDINSLANLVTMARMRGSVEFARVRLNCTTTASGSTPANCQLQSLPYPGTGSWTNEPQIVYLSPGVSFGVPSSIASTGYLPNQSSGMYQGDVAQGVTTNPILMFNSRGIPVDAATGTVPTSDYALYLADKNGSFYAISVNLTGRPDVYTFGNDPVNCPPPSLPCFSKMPV